MADLKIKLTTIPTTEDTSTEPTPIIRLTGTADTTYDLDAIADETSRTDESQALDVKVYTLEEINTLTIAKIVAKILSDYNVTSTNSILNYNSVYENYYSRLYDIYRDEVISENEGNISITSASTSIEIAGSDYRDYLLAAETDSLGITSEAPVLKLPTIQSEDYILNSNLTAEEQAALLNTTSTSTFAPPIYNNHPNALIYEATSDTTLNNDDYDTLVNTVYTLTNRVDVLEDEKTIWVSL